MSVAPIRGVAGIDAALETAARLAERFREGATDRDQRRAFPHAEVAEVKHSGLQALGVPREHGGIGASLGDRCRALRLIAEGDPNIGQIFLVHLFWSEIIKQAAPSPLREDLYRRIVESQLWVGNAASEIGTKTAVQSSLTMSQDAAGWILNGKKFYCTGSLAADELIVTGVDPAAHEHRLAFVPVDTPGVSVIDDWSGMGQRGTASGTTEFVNVHMPADRVPEPSSFMKVFDSPESVITVFAQSLLASIHVGIAKAALRDAIDFILARARPWFQSGVDRAAEDPYVLRHIGRAQSQIDATVALQDQAYDLMDAVAAAPSAEGRGEAIVAASKVKVMSTEVGLEICERLFQVCGASATVARYGHDRHWRNLRTLSLHDPVDYKARLVGDYAVNGRFPEISYYT